MPDVAALLGDAGLLVADSREPGDAVAYLLLGGQTKAQPQPRLGGFAVDRPFRPGIERDAGLERRLQQFPDIDLIGQLHPQEDAALWQPRPAGRAQLARPR